MTAERAVMLVKKVTYFGEFGYLKSCYLKSSILIFLSSPRDIFTLLQQNSVRYVSVGFRPPCWCSSVLAPTWRFIQIPVSLSKRFICISCIEIIAVTWILARFFEYLSSFFSQILELNWIEWFWMVLIFILNYFEWHWKPAIPRTDSRQWSSVRYC